MARVLWLRSRTLAIVSLILASSSVGAQETGHGDAVAFEMQMRTRLERAESAYRSCTSEYAKRSHTTASSAEELADAASSACEPSLGRYEQAKYNHGLFGAPHDASLAAAKESAESLRSQVKRAVLDEVLKLRASGKSAQSH